MKVEEKAAIVEALSDRIEQIEEQIALAPDGDEALEAALEGYKAALEGLE